MAGVWTSDEPLSNRFGVHDVSRDSQLVPSMSAMSDVRKRVRRQHGMSKEAEHAARVRRAREDLVEVRQQDALAELKQSPPMHKRAEPVGK